LVGGTVLGWALKRETKREEGFLKRDPRTRLNIILLFILLFILSPLQGAWKGLI